MKKITFIFLLGIAVIVNAQLTGVDGNDPRPSKIRQHYKPDAILNASRDTLEIILPTVIKVIKIGNNFYRIMPPEIIPETRYFVKS